MSSEWSGFTEEDLRRIRNEYPPLITTSVQPHESQPVTRTISLDNAINSAGRKGTFRNRTRQGNLRITSETQNGKVEIPLTPQQSLACSPSLAASGDHTGSVALLKVDTESRTFQVISNEVTDFKDNNNLEECSNDHHEDILRKENCDHTSVLLGSEKQITGTGSRDESDTAALLCTCASAEMHDYEPSFSNSCSQDKVALEKFEQRRKQMEAENAKRKKVLLEALDDRKKRTREEAKKIAKIQTELGKLDSLLSYDVGILRNQIEMASLEFTAAEKRYEKAEKEFVEAKYILFQKMERKEQLTDYLCTIIEQNEIRKANKLSDLMVQLELDSLLNNCQNVVAPSYPCILNGMTMNHSPTMTSSQVGPISVETVCADYDEDPDPPVVL